MRDTFIVLNQMVSDGVISRYALGGAVGATFYLEPVATLDVDIFVFLGENTSSALLSLGPIYDYVLARGYRAEGEHLVIGDWPVQFLPPNGPLEEEAITSATSQSLEGIPLWVMSAEHLVAIALKTGRAKDFARILQFIESGVLDAPALDDIFLRHGLLDKWEVFVNRFLGSNDV
jgi:hypothetical protein